MSEQRDQITTEDLAGRTPSATTTDDHTRRQEQPQRHETPDRDRSGANLVDEGERPDPVTRDAENEQRTDLATPDRPREAGPDGGEARSAGATSEPSVPLFPAEEGQRFRSRWTDIQAGFVDRPREMVEEADHLVADLMQRLATQFTEERRRLEAQWDSNDDVSTEDLRITLTRYRSFFERLLMA
jgi:hypothetical protein